MLTDYFSAEPLIAARLAAQTSLPVFAADDIADMRGTDGSINRASAYAVAPALWLLYMGDTIGEATASGNAQKVSQKWAVILHVRAVTQNLAGSAQSAGRALAGQKLHSVIAALRGWLPGENFDYMEWLQTPPPVTTGDGFINYPVVFNLPFVHRI